MNEQEMEALQSPDYMDSDHLTDREKAAILWAEHVSLNTAKHRDDIFEIVADQFNDAEVVELTMLCAFRNMRNRFHDSLHIDLDPPAGARRLARGSVVDPKNLKAYLQVLIDNWPDEFPEAPES